MLKKKPWTCLPHCQEHWLSLQLKEFPDFHFVLNKGMIIDLVGHIVPFFLLNLSSGKEIVAQLVNNSLALSRKCQ